MLQPVVDVGGYSLLAVALGWSTGGSLVGRVASAAPPPPPYSLHFGGSELWWHRVQQMEGDNLVSLCSAYACPSLGPAQRFKVRSFVGIED
jgi:hypothetical protein